MATLLPTTLSSSPHMPTPSPLAHHYLVLQVDLRLMTEQQLYRALVPIVGCPHEPCVTTLHTKEASADDSVRTCHVRMAVLGVVRELHVGVRVRGGDWRWVWGWGGVG